MHAFSPPPPTLVSPPFLSQAFKLFRAKTGTTKHFWVHLDKRVPMGAGLGGGSGNGATALWAANVMSGSPASEAQLLEWSAELGSDCPFFFRWAR